MLPIFSMRNNPRIFGCCVGVVGTIQPAHFVCPNDLHCLKKVDVKIVDFVWFDTSRKQLYWPKSKPSKPLQWYYFSDC